MNGQVRDYLKDVDQAGPAMTQDYFNNQAPVSASPACVPQVPRDANMNPLIPVADVPFKYAELEADGKRVLIIVTPYTVSGGPGKLYHD